MASVAAAVQGQDVIIASISGRRDGDAGQIPLAARSIRAGMTQAGVSRLLWIGGAGSLEVAPGIRLLDTPGFPDAYKSEALAQAEVLAEFRATETTIDWTYFSPALIIAPGERTGKFRIGGNQLLKDASGNSHISTEDFVIALLDEAEKPEHHGERITVAY